MVRRLRTITSNYTISKLFIVSLKEALIQIQIINQTCHIYALAEVSDEAD